MASLYADEHISLAVIKALRRAGHDVARARDVFPAGTEDAVHLQRAVEEGRVMVTQDADFLSLSSQALAEGLHHPGVVYWPQGVYSIGEVIRRLKQYLETTTPATRTDRVKFL